MDDYKLYFEDMPTPKFKLLRGKREHARLVTESWLVMQRTAYKRAFKKYRKVGEAVVTRVERFCQPPN